MPRGNKRYLELLDLAAAATPDACAVWPGAVNTKGYPHLTVRYRQVQGHRVVAMLYHGEGAAAMHSCNNKRCVNPHHLRMGTQRDNIRQAWADGLCKSNLPKVSSTMLAIQRAVDRPQPADTALTLMVDTPLPLL